MERRTERRRRDPTRPNETQRRTVAAASREFPSGGLRLRMADWAELPSDVIGFITSFLPLADTHCFSAVCWNWRSVTKEKRYRPVPQLPWLVLTDDEYTGDRRIFNMSEKKHYHLDIFELCDAFIVGSSFGWLFAVGTELDAYLINPFSRDQFSLPSLPSYFSWLGPDPLKRDGDALNDCTEVVQRILVKKAVLSCDPARCTNFVVFICLAGDYSLAFYRSGDPSWTLVDCKEVVQDIVCFKGQYYALLENNVLATVHIDRRPKITRRACLPYDDTWLVSYLVDYNSTVLMLVARSAEYENHHLITTEFRVFNVGLESYNTCELEHIDGHALFLGKNDNIVVRASDFNGCVANSIYFCDATPGHASVKYGYGDMGIYNLEDKSIGHFYPPEAYHPPQSCPIWLVPNTQARPWPWPSPTMFSWAWGIRIIVAICIMYCIYVGQDMIWVGLDIIRVGLDIIWNERIRTFVFNFFIVFELIFLLVYAFFIILLILSVLWAYVFSHFQYVPYGPNCNLNRNRNRNRKRGSGDSNRKISFQRIDSSCQ